MQSKMLEKLRDILKSKEKIRDVLHKAWESIKKGERDKICGKIIEYGILGLIIFSPLPAGSVNEWSILLIQLTVLVMTGAYIWMKGKPKNNKILLFSTQKAKYLYLAFFAFLVFQIFPFPKFMVKIFSPKAASFKDIFKIGFSDAKLTSFSLISWHSFREGLELLTYFFLGFLIVKTVTSREQILRIFKVIIGVGVFEAFYGLFELTNKNPRILFYQKAHGLDSVTGTFINRNHLSGYLEMIIPLALGLLIARVGLYSLSGLRWREKILRLSEKNLSKNLLLSLGIVIMALAVIFSKSRSGIFLLIFTFILFLGLITISFESPLYQRREIKNAIKVVLAVVLVVLFFIGIGSTIDRFSLDKVLQEDRPIFWANTVKIFSDFPLFGTGLGTFSSIYPDLRVEENPVQLFHAHNDYLEYLSELGIVGMVLLLGGVLFLFVYSIMIWWVRRHLEVKGLALGGIVGIACILIHSISDFNLHIPANMLLFSVVLSLTMVTATFRFQEKEPKEKKKKKKGKKRTKKTPKDKKTTKAKKTTNTQKKNEAKT